MALPYYLRIEIDAMLQDIGATTVFWYSDSTPKPTEGNGDTLYIKTDLSEISTWTGSEYSNKSLDLSLYTPNGGNINDTAQSLRDDIDENKTTIENFNGGDAVQNIEVDGTILEKDENGKVVVPVIAGEKGDKGDPFAVDAQGVLADRTAYDGEATGFSFFATDTSLLYFKTDTGWTDGTPFGKGDAGEDGKEIELQKTLTHIQWRYVGGVWQDLIALSEIKGEPGNDGTNGDSTYQIWLNQGNTGNEQDFINSLKGTDGEDGSDAQIDNELRVYQIPLEELSNTPTNDNITSLVAEWIRNNASDKLDINTLGWEIVGEVTNPTEPSTCIVTILSPSEGTEFSENEDITITVDIVCEGDEPKVAPDVTVSNITTTSFNYQSN